MAATSAEYLTSMAEAIRGMDESDAVLAVLKTADEALWDIAEDEDELSLADHNATMRAKTEATP